ncbi:hypothetical protein ASPZODRAFT_137761 [Penicilliopsis zonata CBS 506.65]|uniref:F-box domain-containing protein n=1 Tax=Penicilliopsis zonata CBS 506.65 TaxID=1073090 RepID=A0A1L9SU07_9EURO|nr:hypothetical protein ASPZODRAFT_137761 [Penicilliopsis zonata CBS 506.65]OJJ50604.1 hypothetical protein ASPZODRAFT_137761 [Penicilliopsis zonata CBS 506.65]
MFSNTSLDSLVPLIELIGKNLDLEDLRSLRLTNKTFSQIAFLPTFAEKAYKCLTVNFSRASLAELHEIAQDGFLSSFPRKLIFTNYPDKIGLFFIQRDPYITQTMDSLSMSDLAQLRDDILKLKNCQEIVLEASTVKEGHSSQDGWFQEDTINLLIRILTEHGTAPMTFTATRPPL